MITTYLIKVQQGHIEVTIQYRVLLCSAQLATSPYDTQARGVGAGEHYVIGGPHMPTVVVTVVVAVVTVVAVIIIVLVDW